MRARRERGFRSEKQFGSGMHLLVYCFGGFGKEVIDIARRLNMVSALWETIAFLDDAPQGNTYYGAGVFRLESVQERFRTGCIECVIANGEPVIRKAISRAANRGWNSPDLAH
jgi:hypothetical protein